jgi:Flp pilus assembly pilin Flp
MSRPPSCDAGQGLVEFGLIIALVVVIAVIALLFFGPQLAWALSLIGTEIDKSG